VDGPGALKNLKRGTADAAPRFRFLESRRMVGCGPADAAEGFPLAAVYGAFQDWDGMAGWAITAFMLNNRTASTPSGGRPIFSEFDSPARPPRFMCHPHYTPRRGLRCDAQRV
jgi:hypothetical protein